MDVLEITKAFKKKLKENTPEEPIGTERKKIKIKALISLSLVICCFIVIFTMLELYIKSKINGKITLIVVVIFVLGLIAFAALSYMYVQKDFKKLSEEKPKYYWYKNKLEVLRKVFEEYKIYYDSPERVNIIVNEIIDARDRNKANRGILNLILQIFSGIIAILSTLPFRYKFQPYNKTITTLLLLLVLMIATMCLGLIVLLFSFMNFVRYCVDEKYNNLISCLRLSQVVSIEELKNLSESIESNNEKENKKE